MWKRGRELLESREGRVRDGVGVGLEVKGVDIVLSFLSFTLTESVKFCSSRLPTRRKPRYRGKRL